MKNYSFSLIIPYKKGFDLLKKCLYSVFGQTYINYELIILIDLTSNEHEIVTYLQQNNCQNYSIINSNVPLNIYQNWQRIKEIHKNEFASILGFDDILEPDFLETINILINKYPNCHLFHTHFNYIDINENIIKPCFPMKACYNYKDYLIQFMQNKISIMATGYVFNSNLYNKIGGINIDYNNLIYADVELWLKLIENSTLIISPKYSFKFRTHFNTTQTSNSDIYLNAFLKLMKYFYSKSLTDKTIQDVFKQYGKAFFYLSTQQITHKFLHFSHRQTCLNNVSNIIHQIKKAASQFQIIIYPYSHIKILAAYLIDIIPYFKTAFYFYKQLKYKKNN